MARVSILELVEGIEVEELGEGERVELWQFLRHPVLLKALAVTRAEWEGKRDRLVRAEVDEVVRLQGELIGAEGAINSLIDQATEPS